MIIGIDDTDSKKGGCTTYIAALLPERLEGIAKVDASPFLVRLNPNVKYKTRGNGAVAVSVHTEHPDKVREIAIKTVEENAMLDDRNTNPGIIFLGYTNEIAPELRTFAENTVRYVVSLRDAKRIISKYSIEHHKFKNGRGLIGALAAATFCATGLADHTYELMTYRCRERIGKKREVDLESVRKADAETYPLTWNTIDVENRRVVFAPHSPCPVLYGIRGDGLDAIKKARTLIRSEPVEREITFKTNQGTDMHIVHAGISDAEEGSSYALEGVVTKTPETIVGGHVFFEISDGYERVKCAAFEPTKNFRNIIRMLENGDRVVVYGALKKKTINLEKIEIKSLAKKMSNPKCPKCGRSMESMGKDHGYRCRRSCGTFVKEKITVDREIKTGFYEVPVSARRHLAMPLIRMVNRGAGQESVFPRR
jgi:tRNA(Ile2)-agmatinylcytidine synthase